MEINYSVQNYEWGIRGNKSKVALLYGNDNENVEIDENKPYAELWLGTHKNGPSYLQNGDLLSNFLDQFPEFLGDKIIRKFGRKLPFLFKVLSVDKALSIQTHPSKKQAEVLHKRSPDIYKDPNHKPELAIALTTFEALCGFRPLAEIYFFLTSVPELQVLVVDILEKHSEKNTSSSEFLKEAVETILKAPHELVQRELGNLISRLKNLEFIQGEVQIAGIIQKVHHHYPDDVGCFMVYFLNYIKLKPFEAIYIEPNEPHCYLSGECIECMACSDNVIRAGLTPKYVDVDTLLSLLIYKGEIPENKIFKPVIEDNYSQVFRPPVNDFAVAQLRIPASLKNYKLRSRASASLLLTIEGGALLDDIHLKPGKAVFLPANKAMLITDITADLLIYQSFANV